MRRARCLTVGLDARPALFGRTGFGRVVRESLAALRRRDDVAVRAYGAAWRRARPDAGTPDVRCPRLPARVQRLLAPFGFGVETLLGPLDVFHHTDLVFAPVRRAPEVLTLYDLTFLANARWHAEGFAESVFPRLLDRAKEARAVVVPSRRVADDLHARGLLPPARVVVVPPGCDHVDPRPHADDGARIDALRRRAGVGGDGPLVLAVGTREPRKNHAALVDAFAACNPPPGAALLLAGARGWCCEALERRLQDIAAARAAGRAAPAVAALGEVGEDELSALLRGADVVAYPSLAEGFGLPVAEALRCGRAVLTTAGTPMADVGGEAVLAVDPGDPSALRDALARLLHDDGARTALAAAGPGRVAHLTWDAHAEALVSVYRSVAP